MAKRGRPKTDHPREKNLAYFLTESDAEALSDLARGLGFKGRSTLVTAILESLLAGGFSGQAFVKTWKALDRRFAKHGYPMQIDFGLLFRPPLELPEPDMTEHEIEAFVEEVRRLRKQKTYKGKGKT